MRRTLRHLLKILLGIAFLAAGIVMLVTPGPGWAMIIVGMHLLADYIPPFRRLLDWGERQVLDRLWPWVGRRYPRFHAWGTDMARRAREQAQPYLRKWSEPPPE